MSDQDRDRWDARYTARTAPAALPDHLPDPLGRFEDLLPTSGSALDIACGQGATAVWLARRGLRVCGVDVSTVAIARARQLARQHGLSGCSRFRLLDLDDGLPAGPAVELIVCQRFRDPRLDRSLIDRLRPGGLLAITARSRADAVPARFRVAPGELAAAFASLDTVAAGEGDGQAWLLARKPSAVER